MVDWITTDGLTDYTDAVAFMEARADAIFAGTADECIWLVEHPQRGLLMITAEAFENVDVAFPIALAQTEAIIGSLEFIELN